jgi:pimeloyl-ACP methyl ester carboxylesterase
MPSVELSGLTIAYEETGEGAPIVWIPGTGIGGSVWHRSQIPAFSSTYRCITLDLRGAGNSTAPPGPYSVDGMASDVRELLAHLEIPRAHFVGLSLGSAVIQEIALNYPDLVQSATLISTWSSTAREAHIRRWFEARLLTLEQAPLEVFQAFAFWMWAPTTVDLKPELMAELEAFFAQNSASQPKHAYISHFQADLGHDTYDRLGSISCPTLIVVGTEDLITLPRYNETVAERVPDSRFVEIPEAGHFVWVERPDEVNRAIAEFLDEVESQIS